MSWYCEHTVFLWSWGNDSFWLSIFQSLFNFFSYWNIVWMWVILWCGGIVLEFWAFLACICFLIYDMECFLLAPWSSDFGHFFFHLLFCDDTCEYNVYVFFVLKFWTLARRDLQLWLLSFAFYYKSLGSNSIFLVVELSVCGWSV